MYELALRQSRVYFSFNLLSFLRRSSVGVELGIEKGGRGRGGQGRGGAGRPNP